MKVVVRDESLELMKWVAMVLMTGDHVNKYLFNGTLPFLFEAGRCAMPMFMFVLAYNACRLLEQNPNKLEKATLRIFVTGIIATIPYISLGAVKWGWWPLNILFTLGVVCLSLNIINRKEPSRHIVAFLIVFASGFVVEFFWPALTLGISIFYWIKTGQKRALCVAVLSIVFLWSWNSNLWALASIPTIAIIATANLGVRRVKYFFHVYYPLHLFVLWLIRIPMKKAGYLFFT